MVFSLVEIFDIIFMSAAVGYIFMSFFQAPERKMIPGFDWQSFRIAVIVTAPAIILHELAHKLVALSYGLHATFNAAYGWLGFGILLKLVASPFLFFVPAYVSVSCGIGACDISAIHSFWIAFAGPLTNALLWVLSILLLKYAKLNGKWTFIIHLTKQVNLLLFLFNLIPIPGFDGYKVFQGLLGFF